MENEILENNIEIGAMVQVREDYFEVKMRKEIGKVVQIAGYKSIGVDFQKDLGSGLTWNLDRRLKEDTGRYIYLVGLRLLNNNEWDL